MIAFALLNAALAASLFAHPIDPHPGLPTLDECRAFLQQASSEVRELRAASLALGWPEGGGWPAQRLRPWQAEAERVAAYWEAAVEARHPSYPFRLRWEAAQLCRRLEADGLDVLPLAVRRPTILRD